MGRKDGRPPGFLPGAWSGTEWPAGWARGGQAAGTQGARPEVGAGRTREDEPPPCPGMPCKGPAAPATSGQVP